MEIEQRIREIASKYAEKLQIKISHRISEMEMDDKSHYMIYQVLGITDEEGRCIDVYQNKGRFLYRYAGSFLEEVAKLCFLDKYPDAKTIRVKNTLGSRPKMFEIDLLIKNEAFEIKWRDATTDGDHITKEHTRIKVISEAGYIPIRIMFYYPNRSQAVRIQQAIETLYRGLNGYFYFGDNAWNYLKNRTNIDLKLILEKLAKEKKKKYEL